MKKHLLSSIIIIIDLLLLVAIFYLSIYLRTNITSESVPELIKLEIADFLFVIFIIFALLNNEKIYSLRYDFWQETKKIIKSLVLAYFIVLAILALAKLSLDYSRLFITIYFLLSIILIPVIKRISKRVLYKLAFFKKKILVVGSKKEVSIFQKEFKENWYLGVLYSEKNYNSVIISQHEMSLEQVNQEIEKYLNITSSVYIVPYVTNVDFSNSNIMEYSNIRHNTIQIENKLLIKSNIIIKHIFDFIAITIIFPLFLIVHLVVIILIKLDSPGTIFFKQHRLGKNDNDFICYKYRTMYENSQELLNQYLEENLEEIAHYEKYHKYKNDPRVTKIGKFLRSSSLDELPQVLNILKGEMSLVGPRPYMINESDKLGSKQHFILKVYPGITGLWQVSGRNNLTFQERNNLEIWYIKNWSLWSDFVILVKTIKVVFLKIGAK